MSKPTAKKVITYAKKFVRKTRYGSPNAFTRWYYGDNRTQPWCAIFAYYCLAHTGGKTLMAGCANKAYCPTIWNWARAKKYTRSKGAYGDLVLFDWNDDLTSDHVGFFLKDNGNGTITTIEGNTSTANNSNGGYVQIRVRAKSDVRGYVRLPYAKAKKASAKKTKYKTGKVVARKGVNIRSGAGTKYRDIGGLKYGAKVTCYATKKVKNQTWWKIGNGKWACAINGKSRYIK